MTDKTGFREEFHRLLTAVVKDPNPIQFIDGAQASCELAEFAVDHAKLVLELLDRQTSTHKHEWLDDGQFAQMCPGCGMTEDYSKAFELAFIHGGTEEGNYFLEEDELLDVIQCHVNQLDLRIRESKNDKTKAELYDEVWRKAREMGYNNVTDALSVTPKRK